jgi:hypothetical protein
MGIHFVLALPVPWYCPIVNPFQDIAVSSARYYLVRNR